MDMRIETADLVLREFEPGDVPAIHGYSSDPEVVKYDLWGPNTEADDRTFFEHTQRCRQAVPRTDFELAVTLRETGQLIGGAAIRIKDRVHREGDLGYTLHRAFWGRGLATQAARALVAFGFEHLELHRISATCHPDNVASRRVLEKAGLHLEGHLRGNKFARGAWRDTLVYGVLESDSWKAR